MKRPLRALVVDDEAPARRRLSRQLAELEVEVVGEAGDGEAALEAVRALKPDVVFLDIRMPGLDGLTLAQRFTELPPLVFCTAWNEFAVQAFEVNAVDYLLKPVRTERLAKAVEKLATRVASPGVEKALEAIAPANPARLISGGRGEVRFFDARAVTRLWASDKYTLFFADGAEHLTEESLVSLAQRLAPFGFVQVHRSELIRLDAVRALRSEDGVHEVTLSDGQVARVSRRELAGVRQALLGEA
jgi:DNA-binding LytR/AlgR family response regulator